MKNLLLTVIISCVGINIVIASPKVKLKLISYNIRFLHAKDCGMHAWEARKEASVNMIRREHPDVIGFQEPELPQIEYLIKCLPEYAHFKQDREDGLRLGAFLAESHPR